MALSESKGWCQKKIFLMLRVREASEFAFNERWRRNVIKKLCRVVY